jgi:hypothetical protein
MTNKTIGFFLALSIGLEGGAALATTYRRPVIDVKTKRGPSRPDGTLRSKPFHAAKNRDRHPHRFPFDADSRSSQYSLSSSTYKIKNIKRKIKTRAAAGERRGGRGGV